MNELIGIVLIAVIFIGIFISISITDSIKTASIVFLGATVASAITVVGIFMATGNLKLF